MTVGLTAAMGGGCAVPVILVYYGKVLSAFIDQFTTSTLFTAVPGGSAQNCTECFPVYNLNGSLSQLLGCDYDILSHNRSTYSDIIQSCYGGEISCLNDAAFIAEINSHVVVVICIALGTIVLDAVSVFLLQVTSERLIVKTRLAMYQSVLQQEIGWFDSMQSGRLFSILTS